MQHAAVQFETYVQAAPPDPARMDVACFVGFVAQRPDGAVPTALIRDLAKSYGQDAGVLAGPGGLINRPVSISSVSEFDALFDPDDRLDTRAVITGSSLADTLPGSGVDPTLAVIIDGIIHEIDLLPLPATPDEVVDRVAASGLPITASIVDLGTQRILSLALTEDHGPGTLAVLPYPTLGFPNTIRARSRRLPSAMGQAVRQYFASGGQTAVIIGLGRPPAYDSARGTRLAALAHLLTGEPLVDALQVGDVLGAVGRASAAAPQEAVAWHGIQHLLGLPAVSVLCLPDLCELTAPPPAPLPAAPEPPAPLAAFAECLPPMQDDGAADAHLLHAPVLDSTGTTLWQVAIAHATDFITRSARDKHLVAALPRIMAGVAEPMAPASAFVQLAEGWLRSQVSQTSPEGQIAPDAVLAAQLARIAIERGTFQSAASLPLIGVRDVVRDPPATQPTCRFYADLRGPHLTSDVTTSTDLAWRDGSVSRLMALLIRQARDLGSDLIFEPSGPALWDRARVLFVGLLEAVRRTGALAGTGEGDSYDVLCDRSTMSQQDIDAGRVIAEVSFQPNAPVTRITVRLPLFDTGGGL